MTEPAFIETQRFRQIWLWLLLISISVILLNKSAVYLFQWFVSAQWGESNNNWLSIAINFFSILAVLGLLSLLFFSRLKTTIDKDGVKVILWPLQNKPRFFHWDDIEEVFIRKYRPMDDYGGWGIKHGRKGKAYNISGNMGLQLFLKSGERLLIGTQKHVELEAFLKQNILKEDWSILE